MRKTITLVTACLALGVITDVASASGPAPPRNDNYLFSLGLNSPGERLERRDTLRDTENTVNATVQGDLFNPAQPGAQSGGGPPEPTTCGATSYAKTVWYDFYPDVPGLVRLRASGLDAVISVIPFNRRTSQPDLAKRQCVNESSSTVEEMLAQVRKGGSYTVQLGGVNNAGGTLEFLFDFLADTDGDGVLDDVDRCKRLKGTEKQAGCPVRLRADAKLRARPTATGIEVLGLSVSASRRSRVEVRCSRGCRREVRRAHSTVRFRRVRGKNLGAGSKLVIRVTRRRAIGKYIAYRITRGNFRKVERCLNPGSRKPRRRCG